MSETSELDKNWGLMLGEIRGQLRELIHGQNSQIQKLDKVGEEVIKLSNLPAEVSDIKNRLHALEVEKHRRDGATGLFTLVIKSPIVAWVLLAGGTLWAFLKGRAH